MEPEPREMVENMRKLATKMHARDTKPRKVTGAPYISHPTQVVEMLKSWGYSEDNVFDSIVLAIAWGHDLLEDTNVTMDELTQASRPWSCQVIDGIRHLSFLPDKTISKAEKDKLKAEYINNIAKYEPINFVVVKMADRLCNTINFCEIEDSWAKTYLKLGEKLFERIDEAKNPDLIRAAYTAVRERAEKVGNGGYMPVDGELTFSDVGFSILFKELQMKYAVLKEESATLIEKYNHLVNVVGPNLNSRYMMLIGQFEHRVFELKTDIARWQRRFTLKQKALNVGQKPVYLAIEAQLDAEFEEYIKTIKKNIEEIKEASLLYNAETLTDEESDALRCAYLDAVKKLHPDINPDLPPAAKDLWNQIQKAYEEKDWQNVKFLAGLVDSVVSGKSDFKSADSLTSLKESIGKLEEKSTELKKRMAELEKTVPFTYESFLYDDNAVKERQVQLDAQIVELEKIVKQYEEIWNNGK